MLYNCFSASCPISGAADYEATADDLRAVWANKEPAQRDFEVPAWWLPVTAEKRALDYLRANNSLEAVVAGAAQVRYDPRQDRVVFLCIDQGQVVQAVGRGLKSSIKPKWYKYVNSGFPFVTSVHSTNLAIAVEDAASACAVFHHGVGIALLGTFLTDQCLSQLRHYKNVILALDKDATRKAVELSAVIKQFVNCRIVMLDKDLKHCSKEELDMILGSVL